MTAKEQRVLDTYLKIMETALTPAKNPVESLKMITTIQQALRDLYEAGHKAGYALAVEDLKAKQN